MGGKRGTATQQHTRQHKSNNSSRAKSHVKRVCVRTAEEGSQPLLFPSNLKLKEVAERFHHDCSSGFIDFKTTDAGLFMAMSLDTALHELRQWSSLEGTGSATKPYIVQVERTVARQTGSVVERDDSPGQVQALLDSLGPVIQLPKNATEFAKLLGGTAGMKIPVAASGMPMLQNKLSPELMQLLQPVTGHHLAVSKLNNFLLEQPYDFGKEATTSFIIMQLFKDVFSHFSELSTNGIASKVQHNRTEAGAGSKSSAVGRRLRPDTLIVVEACTLLMGEDKEEDSLQTAINDIKAYVAGGLPTAQYGSAPGIPAYAASGLQLQFLFIKRTGQVQQAGAVMNLGTVTGRLQALRAVIQCYRLVAAIRQVLPPLSVRCPLWVKNVRSAMYGVEVTLLPTGALKAIRRFKAYERQYGVTQEVLKAAYQASEAAAKEQRDAGRQPYLITATELKFSRDGYEVRTTPLGYKREIVTELDAQRLACSCLRAARTLHAVKVVLTDFREDNTVWLDAEHCMVIDLESCRSADKPLPPSAPRLSGWDDNTLEARDGDEYFTFKSDLYQIGKLLQALQPVQDSHRAKEFVERLLDKKLTAKAALRQPWLRHVAAE